MLRQRILTLGLCQLAVLLMGSLSGVAAESDTAAEKPLVDVFKGEPVPDNAYRILFIGDSLTLHGPAKGVWDGHCGMAATALDRDFVHLFSARVQQDIAPRPVAIFHAATGKLAAMLGQLKSRPEIRPDLVIFQGGENDRFDDDFRRTYRELISFYRKDQGKPIQAIVLGDWYNAEKAAFDRTVARENGYPFIDLYVIHKQPGTFGNAGPYDHPGVASHPNDAGMKAIADALYKQFAETVLPQLGKAK